MENKIFKITLLFAVVSMSVRAQVPMDRTKLDSQMNVTKGFFRTSLFRVATSLSADMSFTNEKGNPYLIIPSGNIGKDNLSYAKTPNLSFGLGLDFFSPFSTLGLYIEPGYNIQKYVIKNKVNSLKDSVDVRSFETPIYAKLRFGKPKSKTHTWLALGGGYSFVSKATTKVMQNNTELGSFDSKKQFSSIPYLSAILGWEIMTASSKQGQEEIYDRDDFRILLFAKANYDLANRFDNTGIYNNTALHSYTKPELQFLRVSVGIKFLLRFSKLGAITAEAATKALTK